MELAGRLREIVVRADRRRAGKWSRLWWARHIDVILRDESVESVREVLVWLGDHVHERRTPWVRSAVMFRKEYNRLRVLADRDELRRPTRPADLPKEMQFVVQRLRMHDWPKGSNGQLPGVVARSYSHLRSWSRDVDASDIPGRLESARRSLVNMITPYEHCLEIWFRDVWRRYHAWDRWDGDLGPHVWSPHHKVFRASVSQVLAGQPDDAREWVESLYAEFDTEGGDGPAR